MTPADETDVDECDDAAEPADDGYWAIHDERGDIVGEA